MTQTRTQERPRSATLDPAVQQTKALIQHRDDILAYVRKYGEEMEKLTQRDRFGTPVMNTDYYVASLRLYFAENPKLLECKPLSIARGLLRVAQTGLVLGDSCDLLPFGKVCQYSPRYKGIVQLAYQSGVRAINAHAVYEGDLFEYKMGSENWVSYQPNHKPGAPVIAGYADAQIKQGAHVVEVMTAEQINAHRRQYSRSWYWIDPRNHGAGVIPLEEVGWYAKKTPLRQIANLLPTNPRLAIALLYEREVEEEEIPEAEFEVEAEDEVRNVVDSEPVAAPTKPVGGPRESEGFVDDTDLLE